jgi:hypothetical protein
LQGTERSFQGTERSFQGKERSFQGTERSFHGTYLASAHCGEGGFVRVEVEVPRPEGGLEHSGNIQGTFREHSGKIQGTFREDPGNFQGTYLASAHCGEEGFVIVEVEVPWPEGGLELRHLLRQILVQEAHQLAADLI